MRLVYVVGVEAVRGVDLVVDMARELDGTLLHGVEAASLFDPLQHEIHHVDQEGRRRVVDVGDRLRARHLAVVEHRRQMRMRRAREYVIAYNRNAHASRTEVLAARSIHDGIARNVDRSR